MKQKLFAFTARVYKSGGKLKTKLDYPIAYDRYIQDNFKSGDKIQINCWKWFKQRSDGKDPNRGNQNGYYWSVIIPAIVAETGMAPNEVHEELKAINNPVATTLSPEITKGGSTKIMDTMEFEEYVERCRLWALDFLLIHIPLPKQVVYK